MRATRVYLDDALAVGERISLPRTAAHHVVHVLHLRPGAELTLFNGRGGEYAAELLSVAGRRVEVSVREFRAIERESGLVVELAQGIARGPRMDYSLQKTVELGVKRIQPLLTERTQVRLDARQSERRLAHWRGIIQSACEQCGRNRLPELLPPLRLPDYLARATDALRILLYPKAKTGLASLRPPSGGVQILIGPEGGLNEAETAAATRAGFKPVALGPRVLRTETAAAVAVAVCQALWGDLGGGNGAR